MKLLKKTVLDFRENLKLYVSLYVITVVIFFMLKNSSTSFSLNKLKHISHITVSPQVILIAIFIMAPLVYQYIIAAKIFKNNIDISKIKSSRNTFMGILIYVFSTSIFLLCFILIIYAFSKVENPKIIIVLPFLAGSIFFYKLMFLPQSLITGRSLIDAMTISNKLVDKHLVKLNIMNLLLFIPLLAFNAILIMASKSLNPFILIVAFTFNFSYFYFMNILLTNWYIEFTKK